MLGTPGVPRGNQPPSCHTKGLRVVRLLADQHPVNRFGQSSRQIELGDAFAMVSQIEFILSPEMPMIPRIMRGLQKRIFEIIIAMAIELNRPLLAIALVFHWREARVADQVFRRGKTREL